MARKDFFEVTLRSQTKQVYERNVERMKNTEDGLFEPEGETIPDDVELLKQPARTVRQGDEEIAFEINVDRGHMETIVAPRVVFNQTDDFACSRLHCRAKSDPKKDRQSHQPNRMHTKLRVDVYPWAHRTQKANIPLETDLPTDGKDLEGSCIPDRLLFRFEFNCVTREYLLVKSRSGKRKTNDSVSDQSIANVCTTLPNNDPKRRYPEIEQYNEQ
ncbi:uncharacterized protein AB675_10183 [Cyphellophora attinorum]|uniref:Uncharacterized protein n=1 Tax=Cyphellophora attinorum TaxID=1664694 RepID=A0A0N1GXB8_9EURO|nr:uncharacterized protein AB675_10183 [Phialophora attinorum]KPI34784.1 hypothetical protein AB675_10183 [Phialophora attinorum]